MDGYLRFLLLAALTAAAAGAAEPASPTTTPRERALSPRLASVLTSTLPKYQPPAAGTASGHSSRLPREAPKNNIIRLPDYIVRDSRLPDQDEILTEQGRSAIAVKRYFGPSDGLVRGYLNAFTLAELWQKIPVLGRIPFVPFESMSNEQRTLEVYDRVERKRRLQELLGIEAVARAAEKATPPVTKSTSP